MSRKGGVRNSPSHRSTPAALSSQANSSADPKHKVQGADSASSAGRSSCRLHRQGHPQGSKRWKEGLGQHSPWPQAAPAPGGPESCRFCCFSGFGSSPHGKQLPAPTAACSLCIVRAREQEGGPREKREQEIIRIGNHSRDCSWASEKHTLVACRHRPCYPP